MSEIKLGWQLLDMFMTLESMTISELAAWHNLKPRTALLLMRKALEAV